MEKRISITSNSGLIPLSNCYYLFYSPQNAHTFCLGLKTDFLRGCELPFCTLSSSGENGGASSSVPSALLWPVNVFYPKATMIG